MSELDDVRTTVGVIDGLRAKVAQAEADLTAAVAKCIRLTNRLEEAEAELAALKAEYVAYQEHAGRIVGGCMADRDNALAELAELVAMLRLAREDIRMDCTWREWDDWLADLRRRVRMPDLCRFVVPGKPQSKQRPRLGRGGRVYTPTATLRYERSVAWAATASRPRTWSTDVAVRITVVFYYPDNRVRDVDNALKCLMDGLNGVLYRDDCQVVYVHAIKRLDRENPRAEVLVTAVER